MSQDPFEEFEFRPITEGLGFHKKAVSSSEPLSVAEPPMTKLPTIEMPQTIKSDSSTYKNPKTKLTLNTPDITPTKAPTPNTPTVDDVLESIKNKRNRLNFDDSKKSLPTQFGSAAKPSTWVPSLPDLSAIVLDAMLVLAGVLASLIAIILTTRADLVSWAGQMHSFELIGFAYGLFATITLLYTTVTRVFMGYTAGEWVTDQKIKHRSNKVGFGYLGSVIARSLVNIATAYVVLPIISNAVGSDLAGKLSGATLGKDKL